MGLKVAIQQKLGEYLHPDQSNYERLGEIDDTSHFTLSTNSTAIVSTVDDSMISLHLTIPPKTNDKRLAVGTNQLRFVQRGDSTIYNTCALTTPAYHARGN